jgi:hypothetical protein
MRGITASDGGGAASIGTSTGGATTATVAASAIDIITTVAASCTLATGLPPPLTARMMPTTMPIVTAPSTMNNTRGTPCFASGWGGGGFW